MSSNNTRTEDLETQILEQQKTVDFDTREFTIEIIVQKYLENIDSDENEIYVPDYQREFVWDSIRQSRLIESITLGLPIPIIFVAENSSGRLEIVDGSQRVRTLAAFLQSDLQLSNLEKLTKMNGFHFSDLPISRQRKIKNTPIRMIVLSEYATEEVKNDLFERINRGSDLLRNMEKRKGIYRGPFTSFIYDECAKHPLLKKLAPLAKTVDNRQEHEELILRFFTLIDNAPKYSTFNKGVGYTLDEYLKNQNLNFTEAEKKTKTKQFDDMLNFVDQNYENGFCKRPGQGVSRIFFEAISVGSHLALQEKPDLKLNKINVATWLSDRSFHSAVAGKYHTHTPEKIRLRIDYVKSKLTGLK